MAGGTNALPASGVPKLVEELVTEAQDGASVRVIGRLLTVEFSKSRAVLVDPEGGKAKVTVDTTLVEPLEVKVGSLCEVVGEMECKPGELDGTLRARLLRCVDGLDFAKYRHALACQCAYFKARQHSV